MRLGVNIDHVATLREARKTTEPDPVTAAMLAEMGGADQVTFHLREDRRHIQNRDARLICEMAQTKVNLEMAATKEMSKIAYEFKPDMVAVTCLTTEVYNAQDLLREAKAWRPDVFTVAGGLHATLCPQDFCDPCVDVVCTLPAGHIFRNLVRAVEQGAPLDGVAGLLSAPHGMIVVSGPTGAGKTTTLYAALNQTNILKSVGLPVGLI